MPNKFRSFHMDHKQVSKLPQFEYEGDKLKIIGKSKVEVMSVNNMKTSGNEDEALDASPAIQKDDTLIEVLEDDDYLHCDICDEYFVGDCPKHGPSIIVRDTPVQWGITDRAQRTCPDGISVAKSKIRSGGLGVWADKDFLRNSVFGPYEGVNVLKQDVQQLSLILEGGYAWEIYKSGTLSHYIDGSDKSKSNWLRYINCARNEEEQNLISYQYKGKIYYRAYKDISNGMELLVWYGEQYAEELKISTQEVNPVTETIEFDVPESVHKCQKCGRIFANEEEYQRHRKTKHPNQLVAKPFKCDLCSYSSDFKCNVTRHARLHKNEKRFECPWCSKAFAQKSNLDRHVLSHTKECPYQCSKCGKKFKQPSHLKTHIRTVHEKCKLYFCKLCGCTLRELTSFKKHMLTHSGVRSFKCKFCDQRFTQASHLRSHERTHTGKLPFKCEECLKTFTQSSGLRKHLIVHHDRSYLRRCSVCGKLFCSESTLRSHEACCSQTREK